MVIVTMIMLKHGSNFKEILHQDEKQAHSWFLNFDQKIKLKNSIVKFHYGFSDDDLQDSVKIFLFSSSLTIKQVELKQNNMFVNKFVNIKLDLTISKLYMLICR